jgi:hypothetical protein
MPSIALVHPDISHGQAILTVANDVAHQVLASTSGQARLVAA